MSSDQSGNRSRAGRVVAQWLSSLRHDQRGAVILLVAVSMVAFLGMIGLALDVGKWYQTKNDAQSTADAAALAAANDMAGGATTTAAKTVATTIVTDNDSTIANPTVAFDTVNNKVTVTIPTTAPSYFAQLFGYGTRNVSATSVAKWMPPSGQADGLFAYNSTCNPGAAGILINVNNVNIAGAIHSNGSFADYSNNSTLGPTTYVGASSCSVVNSNHASFTSGPSASTVQSYPIDYSQNLPTLCPTYISGNSPSSWANNNNLTIPPGVYCYSGTITLNANNITATGVTLIASTISISTNNITISPAAGAGNLAIYQMAGEWNSASGTCTSTSSSISTGSNNASITGDVFAPCSTISVTTNNNTANFFEGYNVALISNNISFTGDGPLSGGPGGDALTQ